MSRRGQRPGGRYLGHDRGYAGPPAARPARRMKGLDFEKKNCATAKLILADPQRYDAPPGSLMARWAALVLKGVERAVARSKTDALDAEANAPEAAANA